MRALLNTHQFFKKIWAFTDSKTGNKVGALSCNLQKHFLVAWRHPLTLTKQRHGVSEKSDLCNLTFAVRRVGSLNVVGMSYRTAFQLPSRYSHPICVDVSWKMHGKHKNAVEMRTICPIMPFVLFSIACRLNQRYGGHIFQCSHTKIIYYHLSLSFL